MSTCAAQRDNCIFSRCEHPMAKSSMIKQSTSQQRTRLKVSEALPVKIDHRPAHPCGSAGAVPTGTYRVRKEGWDPSRTRVRILWAAERINMDIFFAHLISLRWRWSHDIIGGKWVRLRLRVIRQESNMRGAWCRMSWRCNWAGSRPADVSKAGLGNLYQLKSHLEPPKKMSMIFWMMYPAYNIVCLDFFFLKPFFNVYVTCHQLV